MTNEFRANAASMAVTMYALKKEGHNHYDTQPEMAGDLLVDLLHFIRDQGGDPEAKLRMAQMNFQAEEAAEELNHSPEFRA